MTSCPAPTLRQTNTMVYRLAWPVLLLMLGLLFASALAQQPSVPPTPSAAPPVSTTGPRSGANDGGRSVLQHREVRYRLRPSDVIAVTFIATDVFNQTVTVQPDGFISLRAVGDLRVSNLSVPEVSDMVRAAYAKIVSPQAIVVELKEFEKPYFIVGGEVGGPGKYDLRGDTTVTQAIAIAGGFRDSAKHSQVLLFRRISDEWTEARKLDIKGMLQAGNLAEDPHLRPGDMLFVPKNVISKIKPFIPTASLGLYSRRF